MAVGALQSMLSVVGSATKKLISGHEVAICSMFRTFINFIEINDIINLAEGSFANLVV